MENVSGKMSYVLVFSFYRGHFPIQRTLTYLAVASVNVNNISLVV